jgi:6-phosphogluconolactonase
LFIQSVNENAAQSKVSSFGFMLQQEIRFLNSQDSKGADPCYIINDDKTLLLLITLEEISPFLEKQ